MSEGRIGRLASLLICIVLGGGAALLLLRYLFPCVLPFLAAWILSRMVLPFARRIGERIHLSERILAPLFLLLLFLGVILLIGFISIFRHSLIMPQKVVFVPNWLWKENTMIIWPDCLSSVDKSSTQIFYRVPY